jgi:hypothetical protein
MYRSLRGHALWGVLVLMLAVAAACTDVGDDSENGDSVDDITVDEPAADTDDSADHPAAAPTDEPTAGPTPHEEENGDDATADTGDQDRLPYWSRWWEDTDLDTHSVPLNEIISGGVPPDGIPPIDEPKFIEFDEADEWLRENEPVISIEVNGDVRAYPLQILTWHEIVNDEIGGVPVAVTFCPLCNAAVAFEREVGDHGVMRFGVSGLLRHSDLIMWDDQTKSFWQQLTGEAIVGELTGESLTMLPAVIVSYEQFKETHPEGIVLSRDTGHNRVYGNNPYVGYDDINSSPFLFRGESDDRMPPMERVLTLMINDDPVAYPYSRLEEHPVVHDEVGGEPVVVFWEPGTTSALDQTSIADSRDVGSANAFSPILDGEELTFTVEDGEIRDEKTGSTWNVLGLATSGELEGERLDEYVNGTHFWFAWAAFQPETRVWSP